MGLSNIYNALGKPGLFEVVSKNKSGAIIESLIDKKRYQLFATDKLTSLNDVQIYSTNGETPLIDVFKSIFTKENGGQCIDPKSDNNAIIEYMKEIMPDYDQERVHVSDMKKLFKWYNLLVTENKLDLSDEEKTSDSVENTTGESK